MAKRKKLNNRIVNFGQGKYLITRFRLNKKYYAVLASIEDGNRWQEPTEVTLEDFEILSINPVKIKIKNLVHKILNTNTFGDTFAKKEIKVGF